MGNLTWLLSSFQLLPFKTAVAATAGSYYFGKSYGIKMFGIGFGSLIGLAICFFIFSVIFWLTYRWLLGNRKVGNWGKDKKR